MSEPTKKIPLKASGVAGPVEYGGNTIDLGPATMFLLPPDTPPGEAIARVDAIQSEPTPIYDSVVTDLRTHRRRRRFLRRSR